MFDVNEISINQVKLYACHLHDVECNQKYNKDLPYSFHLKMVAAQVEKFAPLVNYDKNFLATALKVAYLHDTIEDARVTYNDVKKMFGEEVADAVYCCTELKGKNRAERHGYEFFMQLRQNKLAVFVKLCDIIANVLFSLLSNSSMIKAYKKEYPKIKKELEPYANEYKPLFLFLEKLLND
jgi:(p)ppGpp synthase/HD superfamily hydrolase